MNNQPVLYEVEAGIATITFNRPAQLNAMNRAMMQAIVDALDRLHADPAARVGLLTGGGRAFMAGADLKEYATQTPEAFDAFQALGRRIYLAIEGNAKPVIAALNGHAFGGGLEIALACDLIVAAQGAKMGLPEILLNLIPGGGGTQRLPRKLGIMRANDLLFTGRTVTAEEMHSWGVINHVYPREVFMQETIAFAGLIAAQSSEALRALKQLTQMAAGSINNPAQAFENDVLARLYQTPEAKAKLREFLARSESRKATGT